MRIWRWLLALRSDIIIHIYLFRHASVIYCSKLYSVSIPFIQSFVSDLKYLKKLPKRFGSTPDMSMDSQHRVLKT